MSIIEINTGRSTEANQHEDFSWEFAGITARELIEDAGLAASKAFGAAMGPGTYVVLPGTKYEVVEEDPDTLVVYRNDVCLTANSFGQIADHQDYLILLGELAGFANTTLHRKSGRPQPETVPHTAYRTQHCGESAA